MSKLLTTKQVAERLSIAPSTVDKSRMSGLLLGIKAPEFKKMGRSVRYTENAIEEWVNEFNGSYEA